MSMNRYMDGREIFDRRHGPSPTAAGDGQEGIYSGVLHTAPSGGTCKVIIPALGLTSYRTANVAPYVSGSAGDTCLIAFDEGKIPWVVSAQSLATPPDWIAPTLVNSWTNFGGGFETAGYLKDPLGFVHLKGLITGGASSTVAFTLPVGYRPGALTDQACGGSVTLPIVCQVSTAGNVTLILGTGTNAGLSGITFLAEN